MSSDTYNIKITPVKQSSTSMARISARRVLDKNSNINFYNKRKNSPLTSQNSSSSRLYYLKYRTIGNNI